MKSCENIDVKKKKVGAALVIGGGIAGIQASLDLAESGQKVYLLESTPAIGGFMARLDKTFPTNDCSMCILSPKIVECGRHLNIDVITWSDLEAFSGTAGNFTAKIRKRARYVDLSKCTGCGECANVCPVNAPSEFDAAVGERRGIFRPCPQAYPNAFVIDKKGKSPCRIGCPAGININGYVALTGSGQFDEALDVVLDKIPLPGVLGRVCDHVCEDKCHGGADGNAVSICTIKRFLADRRYKGEYKKKEKDKIEQKLGKVAIIGAGPAGLTAARDLARKGYRPTIFEAKSRAGGMLAWGIPDYRLPQDVLDKEIQMDVLDHGVELKLNTALGRDISFESLRKDYAAIIVAVGAQEGSNLEVPGEQLDGVIDCIKFLREVNGGELKKFGRKVTIVGGGNSAVDAARTALRLGAKEVTMLYRRTRAEMPAIMAEIVAAEEEGIKFEYLAAPLEIVGNGKVTGIKAIRMQLGEPDSSGRRRPVPIKGSEFIVETDMVIPAIGQKVDLAEGKEAIKRSRWGTLDANPKDTSTNIAGVYAIGDAVTGPQSVIKAMAEGQKAAQAVDCYLRGVAFEPLERITADEIVEAPPIPEDKRKDSVRHRQMSLDPAEGIKTFDEFDLGFTQEDAVAEAQRCLHCGGCSECMACVNVCKAGAIDHTQHDVIEDIDVGAVVLVPGFEEYLSKLDYDYGFSRFEDVVTSTQFERILSASGPYAGHVKCPSNGNTPKKIAFLQCVGSRDLSCRNSYCSSVCCMYAIKEAVIAKEHMKGVDVTVFFMDMRAFGKDFDKYYERAKSEYGVKFVRARVSDVIKKPGQENLTVQFAGAGGISQDDFDMVVLSVGLEPSKAIVKTVRKLGVRTQRNGFVWTHPNDPLVTSREGIFVAGVAAGPKDIPETVIQASGAAGKAAALLAESRGSLTAEREYPAQKDINGIEPRVGVFVCHCGINIGGIVNVPSVAEYTRGLPFVVHAEENLYTCSQDTQIHIKEMIEQHNLNRVVVASCSPRTHEPLFQETLKEAGLNPYLLEMANIRDQCSWVHMNEPEKATEKAKELVKMIVSKVTLSEPLKSEMIDVSHSAIVVGGGLAGLTSALAIADQGFEVTLIERTNKLGGNLNNLRYTLEQPDITGWRSGLYDRVLNHDKIKVRTEAKLEIIEGFVGNFVSTLQTKDGSETIEHGAVVVATGGSEYKPTEYLYKEQDNVVTQIELEQSLAKGVVPKKAKQIVMIQCVGSREKGHMYCSRVCCATAVKNAIRIKELSPDTDVYVLYRDMRTYSTIEDKFQLARDMGVTFIRYEAEDKPVVSMNGKLSVTVTEPIIASKLSLHPDLVVLSTRIDANPDNLVLAKMLKVPKNEDGFFLEAHVKLRPVEFATEGIFVAGLAHSPKNMSETIAQAEAAAAKACIILAKDKYNAEPKVSVVDTSRCSACGTCAHVCAYKAIELKMVDPRREIIAADINPALCKGCGACSAACRSGAIDTKGITDQQIYQMIKALEL